MCGIKGLYNYGKNYADFRNFEIFIQERSTTSMTERGMSLFLMNWNCQQLHQLKKKGPHR